MSDSLLQKMVASKMAPPPTPPAEAPADPRRRASVQGGRFARWHTDIEVPQEEEGWFITYLDVMTLLLVMMVVMLAFAGPNKQKLRGDQDPHATQSQVAQGSAPQTEPNIVPPLPLPVNEQGKDRYLGGAPERAPSQQGQTGGGDAAAKSNPLSALPLDDLGNSIEVQVNQRSVSFRISSELLFSSGEAMLTSEGQKVMDRLLPVLNRVPDYTIIVEGHTDNVPIQTARFPSNWELAAGRAASVVRHLQNRGMNPTRLRASGYADTHPLVSNASPEGRAANRRVEITLEAPASAP
jgi:chemotaxis protein MotB